MALSLLISACAAVDVNDFEACADMGTAGATCAHFLTTETRDIEKSQWDDERFAQLCISGDAYADIKREIESLCSMTKGCVYKPSPGLEGLARRARRLSR